MKEEESSRVALYWDFENLHASVYERIYGTGSYLSNGSGTQEPVVDIRSIMEYARGLGTVCINNGYANWQWFARYRDDLNKYGFNLVQMFPRGMKNGADIRLAVDVMDDLRNCSYITHVIIVAGDSDYISLADKVKRQNKIVIGIGVLETSNRFWVRTCHDFRFYASLLPATAPSYVPLVPSTVEQPNVKPCRAATPVNCAGSLIDAETGDQPDTYDANASPLSPCPHEQERRPPVCDVASMSDTPGESDFCPSAGEARLVQDEILLTATLQQLAAKRPDGLVSRATLKHTMRQIDPTFDDANLGFASFTHFLEAFPQLVEIVSGHLTGWLRLRSGSADSMPIHDRKAALNGSIAVSVPLSDSVHEQPLSGSQATEISWVAPARKEVAA